MACAYPLAHTASEASATSEVTERRCGTAPSLTKLDIRSITRRKNPCDTQITYCSVWDTLPASSTLSRVYVYRILVLMNVTSYLPDDLVKALDRLARAQHSSRSAVIRQALEMYIQHQQAGPWPQRVREWRGDPEFPAFEWLRATEQAGGSDPFEGGTR